MNYDEYGNPVESDFGPVSGLNDPNAGPVVVGVNASPVDGAGIGNTNGSGGTSLSTFLGQLGNLGQQGIGIANGLNGNRQAARTATSSNTTLYLILGGAVLLILVVFMGRR